MSEYQYYEFQAIDRPLTNEQILEVRRFSSRAEVTATHFSVEYNWGDFKGNPERWMEQYFDAFVHVANWGTRWFMLRLPCGLLAAEVVPAYCGDEWLSFHVKDENLILSFRWNDEGGDWVDGEGWLSSLVALRADLIKGDYRCLYLAWLGSVQGTDYEGGHQEVTFEPPVPPGLRTLSPQLKRFVDFFDIDFDLIAAAAERSEDEVQLQASRSEIAEWVRALSLDEKESLLTRIIEDDVSHPEAALRRRLLCETRAKRPVAGNSGQRRTVAEILARGNAIMEDRRKRDAQKAERERKKREQEQAEQRKRHLESMRGKEIRFWDKADMLIGAKQPKKYDEAVSILQDLRELAEKDGTSSVFFQRMERLRSEHASKPALLQRFKKARLSFHPDPNGPEPFQV